MIQFTHENHLKFGWGNGLYNFDDKDQQFWFTPGKVNYIPTSFKDECLRSARLIGEAADKPILLGLSGGVDSEVAARSFIEAGVPFEVVVANVIHDGTIVNARDTRFAKSFANKYNIKCHMIDIDFRATVDRLSKIRETNNPAEPYYKINISNLCNITMLEPFCNDYFCLKGSGDLVLNTYRKFNQPSPRKYGLYIGETTTVSESAVYEMSYRNSANIINFFCYTPEAWLAWLLDPDVRHWVRYEKAFMGEHSWMNNYAIKSFVLFKIWPDMEIRTKLTGYEYIAEYKELTANNFYVNDDTRLMIPIEEFTEQLLTGTQCI